jgi:hypothetical protein
MENKFAYPHKIIHRHKVATSIVRQIDLIIIIDFHPFTFGITNIFIKNQLSINIRYSYLKTNERIYFLLYFF